MRPVTLTQVGVGQSVPCPLDWRQDPFQVTLQVTITGTVTASVEVTNDDVYAPGYNPATGTWVPVTGLSGINATAQATLISPVIAARINQTVGTGTTVLKIVTAGL